jgi:hypothetical protein
MNPEIFIRFITLNKEMLRSTYQEVQRQRGISSVFLLEERKLPWLYSAMRAAKVGYIGMVKKSPDVELVFLTDQLEVLFRIECDELLIPLVDHETN